MKRTYLLLGSNQGNRQEYLEKASSNIELIAGKYFVKSSIYQTAAWGKEDQATFLNQVIGIKTKLTAIDLLKTLLTVESKLGRTRSEKWGSRTIDIDILFYGAEIITTPDLIIPHPRIAERRFTLVPMVEIAARLVHPSLGKSMEHLLIECPDKLPVDVMNEIQR